jgi:hypothetical protein
MDELTGLNRIDTDKFYTKPTIVNKCIDYVKSNITINTDDLIVEPSSGGGAFLDSLLDFECSHKFYDTSPEDERIEKKNYLILDISGFKESFHKIHVIGNPPFGRQTTLAKKFIKKSASFCDTISFILPRSFKKESMIKSFPKRFHLVFETDLPESSFTIENKDHNVSCVFQIWEKRDYDRDIPDPVEPCGYKFVSKSQEPHLSFRRVGVYAGKVDTFIDDKSIQSHYFIRITGNDMTNEQVDKLNNITYPCAEHTVGPKSISKQELIIEFNKIFSNTI